MSVLVHAVHELRPYYPLPVLLEVSGMARSSYYYHSRCMQRPDKYKRIKRLIIKIFQKHQKRYGYRRITASLQKEGVKVNHKTVYRLMSDMGLVSNLRRKNTHPIRGNG